MKSSSSWIEILYPLIQTERGVTVEILPASGPLPAHPFPARSLENILIYGNLPGIQFETPDSAMRTLAGYVELYLKEEILDAPHPAGHTDPLGRCFLFQHSQFPAGVTSDFRICFEEPTKRIYFEQGRNQPKQINNEQTLKWFTVTPLRWDNGQCHSEKPTKHCKQWD
jgi:hypothetical protein